MGKITSATSIQDLEDVVGEWGGTLNFMHAAAAFTKAGNLAQRAPKQAYPLLRQLDRIWDTVMQDAGQRQQANVSWACGRLGYAENSALWSNNLAAFVQLLQHPKPGKEVVLLDVVNVAHALATILANKGNAPGVSKAEVEVAMQQLLKQACVFVTNPHMRTQPQAIANLLWACAKLCYLPENAAMGHLLQALARSDALENAKPQELTNALYAVSELQQRCGWQPQIQRQVWQRLLSDEQMVKAAAEGNPQHVSNLVLAVARLATADQPVLSKAAAQHCVQLLLQGQAKRLKHWGGQDVGNAMWACGKLGIVVPEFFVAVAADAHLWVPRCKAVVVIQVLYACAEVKFCCPELMRLLVQRSQQQLQQQTDIWLAVTVGWAVAQLNLHELAADAKQLVAGAVHGNPYLSNKDVTRLQLFHNWLVKQQLLDGQGLAGLLTQQQLARAKTAS